MNTSPATTPATPTIAPVIAERTGTARAPRPASSANRRPRTVGGEPPTRVTRFTTELSCTAASARLDRRSAPVRPVAARTPTNTATMPMARTATFAAGPG